jgi:predicted ribosomally synthesized peptide with nif11-like leader
MSSEGLTALYERLESDPEFRTRVEQASTPQEKRRIVTAAGYNVDQDDVSTLRSLSGGTELSDEDLEKVAGGVGSGTLFGTGVAGSAVSLTAAAAALAAA